MSRTLLGEITVKSRLTAVLSYIDMVKQFWDNVERLGAISSLMTEEELTAARTTFVQFEALQNRGAIAVTMFCAAVDQRALQLASRTEPQPPPSEATPAAVEPGRKFVCTPE